MLEPPAGPQGLRLATRIRSPLNWLLPLLALAVSIAQVQEFRKFTSNSLTFFPSLVYLPLAVFIVLLWIRIRKRTGTLTLHEDSLAIQQGAGPAKTFTRGEIQSITINSGQLRIQLENGHFLSPIHLETRREAGWAWLWREYGMPAKLDWGKLNDFASPFKQGTRHFLEAENDPTFGDIGAVLSFEGIDWYLPTNPTVDLRDLRSGTSGHYGPRPMLQPIIQLSPTPAELPTVEFAAAIINNGSIASAERIDLMDTLAEEQGGQRIIPTTPGHWQGECRGMQTVVMA